MTASEPIALTAELTLSSLTYVTTAHLADRQTDRQAFTGCDSHCVHQQYITPLTHANSEITCNPQRKYLSLVILNQ